MSHSLDSRLPPRLALWILIAAGIAIVAALVCFLGLGRWLMVQDRLEKAEAIAVLSGSIPLRAIEAAKLYHEGYAPQIWLTRSTEPAESLQAMDIPFVGEDFYNLRVLIHQGVPPDAIRVLKPAILNTADEINVIALALEEERGSRVIIVTTKVHTRRVQALWQRLARGRGRAIVRAASDDPFEPHRWWRTTGDALDVVREVLGLLNTWSGLPLHAAR
jgi:uncharacterized SAM-binding protein YcdF (DUF218 family)